MIDKLLDGYRAFRAQSWPTQRAHYAELAKGQSPDTLVIACSDSRVDPATIFDAAPGELFVVRNVAAIVPPCEADTGHHGTSAALAFAVLQLKVREILVMGHAQCGGVAAALDPAKVTGIPFLSTWIDLLAPALDHSAQIADGHARHEAMERDCVRLSLENLMTFGFVKERVETGLLTLRGARFGIADGRLEMLDPASGAFAAVD